MPSNYLMIADRPDGTCALCGKRIEHREAVWCREPVIVHDKCANTGCYLSTADGLWTVIHGSQQLCAMTTRERAHTTAMHYRLTLPSVVWNGNLGAFVEDSEVTQ